MYKKIEQLKLLLLGVLLGFLLFPAQKAFAQDANNIFSSSYVFSTDLSAEVTFREEFTNTSGTTVVDKYRVIIPYSDASDIQMTIGGQTVQSEIKSYEAYKEATVDLPDISSGQNVKIITSFKTSLAAKDFGGMKVISLANIDSKVTLRGQTVILPATFDKISSISASCEVSYVATTNITCATGDRLYVTLGEKYHFNFDLKQLLKNSLGKNIISNFLLPLDGLYQNMFFYETLSDLTAKKDDAGNLYIETKITKDSEKEIEVSGILEGNSRIEVSSDKSLTEETEVWDFSSNEISEIYSSISGDSKAQEIYSYLINNHKPSIAEEFTRKKVSEFAKNEEMTSTQYADLAVALLRKVGIKSFAVIGKNNGNLRIIGTDRLTAWVLYFDANENAWKGMDPYFADNGALGTTLFLNPDRIAYFVIDGSEDEELHNTLIEADGAYVEIYPYEVDEELLNKEFDDSVKIVAPEKVSLNVDAEISLSLTNNSSRLIHFSKIYNGSKEIVVQNESERVWVLPSQTFIYDLKGIVLTGLLKTVSANLNLDYEVVTDDEAQTGSVSSEISAVPTFKTFLPYIFVIGVISLLASGYFLYKSIRKRLKTSKN